MGVVIPFPASNGAKSSTPSTSGDADERAIAAAIGTGTDQHGILAAARPLLDRCRDRYGFVVMRDGLPTDAAALGNLLLALARGLATLDVAMAAPRTYPTFGVYFGRARLAWFEDGYSGTTGLAVPNGASSADIAAFVRLRVTQVKSRSGA